MLNWLKSRKELASIVGELVEHIEKLSQRQKALELDWENMYDKLLSMVQRITKRAEVIEKAEQSNHPEASDLPVGGRLTEHQREVQQQILRRRAGL